MNILVAGATGNTGLRLVNILKANGHTPIALVRESTNAATARNRLINLAAQADVSRFVMLSSAGADNPDPDSKIGHYVAAVLARAVDDAECHGKAFLMESL